MATVKLNKLIPVMLCFFAMGFVDLVGIASNYVKADLGLSDSQANIFPSLVFFWFLIFSVPTGILMNRIGRPYRPQEDCIAEPCCDIRIAAASYIRRQLHADALFILLVGYRKCPYADIIESAVKQHYKWR